MKRLRFIGFFVLLAILFFGLFLFYSTLTYFNPQPELIVSENSNPDTIPCNFTLKVISWNIGYAGLGENMDFFYDNGKRVRDTKRRTVTNLDSITRFLRNYCSANFFLIQEVDLQSKRSYYINQKDTIAERIGYYASFAQNYVVSFVPIPLTSPMGKVNSGILNISKYASKNAVRYSYPGKFSWPNRLFNLRRCMLINRYPTNNGKEFILVNTHMSAFDNGQLKKQEMNFLHNFILGEFAKGNYIIVGGDWNQSPPEFPLNTFGENYKVEFFKLTNISVNFVPKDWKWVYDPTIPTNRYINEPFIPGKTFSSIIDIFLVSPNVDVIKRKTVNLNFQNSDHNPILIEFNLRQ